MLPLVIYHANCWDGFCAAWVARKALGEIEAVAAQYGTRPPDVTGRVTYVLDFSYPTTAMEIIALQAEQLVVIDHHQTAFATLDRLRHYEHTTCIYDNEKSGGRLAWEFFFPRHQWDSAPWLVDYTEDRDLWRHALPDSQEINAALRSYPLDFDLWDRFESRSRLAYFKTEGQAIRRREQQIVTDHLRHARRQYICGHHVPVVNATVLFSEIAGELAKGEPFGACYFDRSDGKRQWSLRSTPEGIDVSEIAKANGGGGHQHAAGFEEALD